MTRGELLQALNNKDWLHIYRCYFYPQNGCDEKNLFLHAEVLYPANPRFSSDFQSRVNDVLDNWELDKFNAAQRLLRTLERGRIYLNNGQVHPTEAWTINNSQINIVRNYITSLIRGDCKVDNQEQDMWDFIKI
jgi:hypothetical protein